ncbi:hypothetical protein K458DRAFT_311397 [Lentithecium fluviatile CBS 122367]|uniref:Saccharopine dehydrogenase NADP binding domain-containing protein n=1 Tax=Lentithecium fluviatile CBS 122367 TaxID=1168545 RepID=A0A6G1IRY4_9PLEO|nr:hypothetical protein K458DRAFT_311397 [Lentithecium fluviatile CBS 122367]
MSTSPTTAFLIYGATGYTGRIACNYANSLGLNFVIAGRTQDKTIRLASSLTVPYRIFSIDDADVVVSALKGIRVLLNCAGPFTHTAKVFMDACTQMGVHYLDISAELDVFQLADVRSEDAVRANVMLMPGCGGSVAMLGCLVGNIIEKCESPTRVDVALHVAGSMSRGSAITSTENLTTDCFQRLQGSLVPQNISCTKDFDFSDGRGKTACFPITLPDLITIWKSTGIANISTFVHASDTAFPTGDLSLLPDGPSAEQRLANPYHAAADLTEADGTVRRAVLHTVNGYTFTPVASVEAVRRVLDGQFRPGFQTPADVFGSGFVETIAGSSIKHL